MPNCRKYNKWFIDALHEPLSVDKNEKLEIHLKECSHCAEQYNQLLITLKFMGNYKRPEPKKEFWDNYWTKLEPALQKEQQKKVKILKWTLPLNNYIPRISTWGFRLAAAVILLAIGMLVGRYYLGQTPAQQEIQIATKSNALDVTPVAQAKRYIERSKLLLLGIVNYDTEPDATFKPDFTPQQDISRQLLREAADLKDDLQLSKDLMLFNLISELETILMEIAALEQDYDLEAVEMIQSGIERKGVLFKINLGEIISTDENTKESINANGRKPKDI
jgi:hypothetical protein